MRLVKRDEVQPAPPAAARTAPDPYRVLFPVGIAAAIAGLVPWILVAARVPIPYPGPGHAALMVQGFELAFVCGFLLTAMPAFTHGPRCSPAELGTVTALVGAHVVLAALGVPAAAWAFLAALGALGFVVARRVRPGEAAPPEEFLLVGTGMALGLAGAVVQVLAALGRLPEAAVRAGVRCVSLGMLPALVLGLGGLLVPTFARMSDPLTIAGIAKAGERPRRRAFVLTVAGLLVLAVNLDFAGLIPAAAWCRALAALASTQLAWKLWRLPGRRDRLSWAIWTAGWCVALGFTAAAVWPLHRVEAWHVAFAGGYALLTLGIGTRVVVSHGGHAMTEERVVLSWWAVAALAVATLLRALGPVFDPERTTLHQAAAAGLAALALVGWFGAAWPRIRRARPRLLRVEPPPRG
ncbi:MAG TPA: NnrS family protein [Methylomirabilota bacterium]|nr:NnrS family protein [Methylomirabilota bacterium]